MRVAIYGAGALGCYFGARLQKAGHDVYYVARGPHLEAMQKDGLRVEIPSGDFRLDKVHAVASIAEAGPADVVFFAVKNYDVVQASADLAAAIHPEAAIVTVQNGVSAQPLLAKQFGRDRILPAVVRMPADIKEPGVIRVPADLAVAEFVFGTYDGTEDARAQALFEACTDAGIGTELSGDIWRTLWEKFIPLSAFSAMTGVSRLDLGALRETQASREMLLALVEETAAVARADHSTVPQEAAKTAFDFMMGMPGGIHASMLDDLLRGRRLELEWLSGEVVRRGKSLGISTPAHAFSCAVLAPYVNGRPKGSH